jgi:hypothetical protein
VEGTSHHVVLIFSSLLELELGLIEEKYNNPMQKHALQWYCFFKAICGREI